MKIAVAGKGGVGKTTIIALLGEYLASQGAKVWLLDADTSPSLGLACGAKELPIAISESKELVEEFIGSSLMCLNPDLSDLPERIAVDLPLFSENDNLNGSKKLLMLGRIQKAAAGCACSANALVKALISHMILEEKGHLLIDMEAGLEHLGRATISGVDALIIVSEPSYRALDTASAVSKLASELGLKKQILVINRAKYEILNDLPKDLQLPELKITLASLKSLEQKQWSVPTVLGIYNTQEEKTIYDFCSQLCSNLEGYKNANT